MPVQSLRWWRRGWILALGGALAGWLPPASAQSPPPPVPAPTPGPSTAAPAEASPEQFAERLRKLEEMNQRLLQQYESVSKENKTILNQNEALSKTVQDLSKRLEEASQVQRQQAQTPAAGGRAGPRVEPPITGGLTSPPSPERVPRAGRDLLPLRAFYDQNYQHRYGYLFQSENQEFELRVNGELQVDSRIYEQQHQNPVVSDLDIPRARIYFSGRLTKPVEYQLSFQRSNNSLDLLNAYLNFDYDDRLQLRFGRFRAPFTYEWAKLSNWEFLTPERTPFAANFGPNRQIGLMGWGNVLKNRLEYAVGIFDGPRNSYQDFNNAKDVMAFLDFRPFFQTETALKTLSVGGSVDAGQENNPLVPALLRGSTNASGNTLATGSGDSLVAVPFLAFNNNVRERGDRKLWELHATYFYKGLSVLGAWDSGINSFALTTPNARPVPLPVSGFHVQVGYLITGETLEKRALVAPLHPFDLRKGKFGLGALELQARYSELEVGRQVFTGGLADPNLWTNRASFVDAGFNWYLNKYLKFYFDWEHAMFAQPVLFAPGRRQLTSDLYWLRLQVWF
jgi:phosphate-selective porin OprO/OprP